MAKKSQTNARRNNTQAGRRVVTSITMAPLISMLVKIEVARIRQKTMAARSTTHATPQGI